MITNVPAQLPQTTGEWAKLLLKDSGFHNIWVRTKRLARKVTEKIKHTEVPDKKLSVAQKPKNAVKVSKGISDDLKPLFANLECKTGQEFVDVGYNNVVEYMKLKGIAPANIAIKNEDGLFVVTGGFDPVKNTIEYSKGFLSELSPKVQMNLMAHELKHCEQFSTILRTEGLGVESYARTIAQNSVYGAIKDSSMDVMFKMRYKKALSEGKGDGFIQKAIEMQTEKLVPQIENNFSDVLKLPKFSAESPEGIRAKKYLDSFRDYEGLNFLGLGSDAYRANALEVEAYSFGDEIEKLFEKFTK